MRDFSRDHRWLSINTATLRGAGTLDTIIEACVCQSIRAISPWRDQVHAIGFERTAELVRSHALELSGYCRGGMFPAMDAAGRRAALDDNRRAVDEAKTLNAACLVLVVGGLPGALTGPPQHKDIAAGHSASGRVERVAEIERLLERVDAGAVGGVHRMERLDRERHADAPGVLERRRDAVAHVAPRREQVLRLRRAGEGAGQAADDEHQARRVQHFRFVDGAPVVVERGLPRGGVDAREHAAAAVA